MTIEIPASTREVIRASVFRIGEEPYVYVKAGRIDDESAHLLVLRDDLETTVVTFERNLAGVEVLDRNRDRWALVSIDCANPFYCVGFLASIAGAFTYAGLDILVLSAFTRDLVFVKDDDRERARELMVRIGFRDGERPSPPDPAPGAGPAPFTRRDGRWLVSDERLRVDLPLVHDFLANRSYWAPGIPIETVRRSIENSMPFGLYDLEGGEPAPMVAFARVVTDRATFGWLSDVFVVESQRGRGHSKRLVAAILEHPELKGLRRLMLATADAHGLYHAFGWKPLKDPARFLEIHKPDAYGPPGNS